MGSSFGTNVRVQIFGQSHSAGIGCVVDGLPSGFAVDLDELARFMARRAPGKNAWSTARSEADRVRVLGGLNERGETCGAPLACLIENTNTKSSDYDELRRIPRPGHADLTAQLRWQGAQDVAGGGHFSGRLTAALCAAGGVALQMLAARGIRVGAHLLAVAGVRDIPLEAYRNDPASRQALASQLDALADERAFPTLSEEAGRAMRDEIARARADADSVGGIIECIATGVPAGLGSPLFDGIESSVARILFGIPAVKGVEFGRGFEVADLRGSENNDPFAIEDGEVRPQTNNAGGNLGGITTGAPLVFRMALKPTPSIARPQASVDLFALSEAQLEVRGRHDPCIAPRAVPVAEAALALAVLDALVAPRPTFA